MTNTLKKNAVMILAAALAVIMIFAVAFAPVSLADTDSGGRRFHPGRADDCIAVSQSFCSRPRQHHACRGRQYVERHPRDRARRGHDAQPRQGGTPAHPRESVPSGRAHRRGAWLAGGAPQTRTFAALSAARGSRVKKLQILVDRGSGVWYTFSRSFKGLLAQMVRAHA